METTASRMPIWCDLCHAKLFKTTQTLQWRHNGRDGVSNYQPHDCLLDRILAQIKENIKAPRDWPLCGEFTSGRWIPRIKGQ